MFILASFICILLIVATAIVEFQIKKNITAERLINRQRVRSWWAISMILISALYIGGWPFKLLLFALILWAILEFSRLLRFEISSFKVLFFSIAMVGYEALVYIDYNFLLIAFLLPFFLLAGAFYSRNFSRIRIILILLFCISSVESIQIVGHLGNKNGYDGELLILFLFFIVATNDIAQYISGKLWGGTKLSPKLSPGKTYEGALGGVIFTSCAFALMLPNIIHISWGTSLFLGGIISAIGISGDISISYYKREASVKDTGISIPGHGGLLDRIDSLMLMAPTFGLYIFFNNSTGY